MTEPQVWTLIGVFAATSLGLVTLVSTLFVRVIRSSAAELSAQIGGLRGEHLGLRGELGAQIDGLRGEYLGLRGELSAQIAGLRAEMNARFDTVDARFEGVDRRMDALDRDVQALVKHTFGLDRG